MSLMPNRYVEFHQIQVSIFLLSDMYMVAGESPAGETLEWVKELSTRASQPLNKHSIDHTPPKGKLRLDLHACRFPRCRYDPPGS
jgi:hypothetical protein